MGLLDRIAGPDDLRILPVRTLKELAKEIRERIIETVGRNGGHLASNLGIVETTIALHRVFNSPEDAIVWDVGHQCYPHKLLTGRAHRFHTLRRAGGISGFPKHEESRHDIFDTGHSSTAISAALGLLEARKRNGVPGRVIAVIGDGTLTSGMAMEGLSNAGHLQLPLILVLNDNRMSISRSVGSISRYLSRLSASVRYQSLRVRIDNAILRIPHFGKVLFEYVTRSKNAVKQLFFKENLFSEFGFEYVGPIDGHNLGALIAVFEQVRKLQRPVVVHVVTKKGKGLDRAEVDPEAFHGVSPSCSDQTAVSAPSFTKAFSDSLIRMAGQDARIVAVTAAMASGTGVSALAERMPERVFDVGIAEQHAVTFAAGMARGGLLPVVAIYSTFMQRAVDQVFQDVCLAGLPVLFALDRAGAVGEDGETHQGIYDIPLYKSMPNLLIFAPSDDAELDSFMRLYPSLGLPCMMRYPKDYVPCASPAAMVSEPLVPGRGVLVRHVPNARMLICAVGPLVYHALQAALLLEEEDIPVDVYNVRFIAPLDEEALADLLGRYEIVLTAEDGVVKGGFGESLAGISVRYGLRTKFKMLGFGTMPLAQAPRAVLLASAGLDAEGIARTAASLHAASVPVGVRYVRTS